MSAMTVVKFADGLWRWTAPVGSSEDVHAAGVYVETPGAIVVIDPPIPGDPHERERFWRALDRDVARLGVPVHIALTSERRRRDTDDIARRYPGTRVAYPGEAVLGDVVPYRVADGEWGLWIRAHRAFVVGNASLGRNRDPGRDEPRYVITTEVVAT